MTKTPRFAAIALGAAAVAAVSSCDLTGPKTGKFVVAVDSLVVPDSVGPSDTLFVGLRGIISTGEFCASYDSYTRERTGGTIKYTVYGFLDNGKQCVATLVLLRKTDTVLPPQVNPTMISANNPPGTFPESRTILVK